MTRYRFSAQALTPVHIGCGLRMDPGEFLIEHDSLLRFNPAAVLADISDREREEFLPLADQGDIKRVQAFFRRRCDPVKHDLGRIAIGEAVHRELDAKLRNPNNRFEIELMPRNPITGAVYLPGSSLKGAIRTAVVNYFTNLVKETRPGVHAAVNGESDMRRQSGVLEEKALDRRFRETERDVFRLLAVSDVTTPPDSTRVDRIYNWNPNKKGSEDIQIWVERFLSRADGNDAPELTVTLGLDEQAALHPKVRTLLGRTLDVRTIADACNRFYWGRLCAERDKFFGKTQDGLAKQTAILYRAMSHIWCKDDQGRVQVTSPNWPHILLRLGRFCQFESLSVDELRKGHRPQAKHNEDKVIQHMGSTRNLCDMGKGKPAMPCGWLLLSYEGQA